MLVASGRGDSMSGTKLAFDYNYKLTGGWIPLWLDFGVNAQHAACRPRRRPRPPVVPTPATCSRRCGGVKWTFATPLPLVPYVGAVGGLAFAFPNGASAATGLMVRAVGGANYFFFDWLGWAA